MYLDDAYQPLRISNQRRHQFGQLQSLQNVSKLSPNDFVDYCGTLFEADGYIVYVPTSLADPDVDLLLVRGHDVLIVQCDHSPKETADLGLVQQLKDTTLRNDGSRGIFITTGKIDQDAILWAANHPIDLLDGQAFTGWMNFVDVAQYGNEETSAVPQQNQKTKTVSTGQQVSEPPTSVKKKATDTIQRPIKKPVAQPAKATKKAFPMKRWLLLLAIGLTAVLFLFWLASKLWNSNPEDEQKLLTVPTREVNEDGIAPTLRADEENANPTPELANATIEAPVIQEAQLVGDFELPAVTVDWFNTNDENYTELLPISIGHQIETMDIWDGSKDMTAVWKVGYDTNYFYHFITVKDDTYIQRYPPATAYIDDSLEIEIDTSYDRANTAQSDDFQYIISPGDFAGRPAGLFRYNGQNGVMRESYGTKAEVQSIQTDDGYKVAVRIPWYDISLSTVPKAGTKIGLTLIVNDKDVLVENKQEIIYSNVTSRKWNTPNTWGTMTFGEYMGD